jgi:hypothetical protein
MFRGMPLLLNAASFLVSLSLGGILLYALTQDPGGGPEKPRSSSSESASTESGGAPAASPAPFSLTDFDPKSLTDPELKALYEQGYKQGASIVDNYCKNVVEPKKPSKEAIAKDVKEMLQDRETALQVEVQVRGPTHPFIVRVLGRRVGLKDALVKHNLPTQ